MTERAGAYLGAALAPVAVVAVDPWGWYPFGPLRWALTTTMVAASFALLARPGWIPRSARGPLWTGLALAGATAAAAALGLDPLYAWTGTPERHAGVLLWVLCIAALAIGAHLGQPRHRDRLARGLVLAAVAVAAVGLAEALGWEPRILDAGDRLTGTFGSSAYLGGVCALLLPVAIGLARTSTLGRNWTRAALAAALALVVPLVGSGARSAWLGLALAAAAAAWARRHQIGTTVRARPGRATVLAGAALAAVALLAVLSPAGSRATGLLDDDAPGGRARLDEWRVATRVLADHAVLGVGPEGYRVAFAQGVDAAYERAHGREPLPDRAHSAPLDVALAGGIFALAAWVAWVGLVGRRCWWALRDGRGWAAGLGAGLVAHLGGQLTLFPLAEVEPLAWLLAGALCVAVPRPTVAAPAAESRPSQEVRADGAVLLAQDGGPADGSTDARARLGDGDDRGPVTRASTAYHRGLRAVAGAATAVALVAGVADVAADRRANRAAEALAGSTPGAAVEQAEAAARLRPDTVRLHLLLARARLSAEKGTVAALDAVDDAARTSPGDPVVIRERLRLLIERAGATEVPAHARTARAEVAAALDEDPINGELWLLAGEAARLDGDPAGARRAWTRAEDLAPRRPEPPTNLALLAHVEGRRTEAEAALARARALAPDDPGVRAATQVLGPG